MRYRLLGKSGVRISEVALGTMTFGEDWGWGASPDVSARMLDLFADAGGNVIDTADVYTNGTSETILGELLKGRRDRFVLATKFTNQTDPGDPNSAGNHRKKIVTSIEDEPASTADRPHRPVLGARPRPPHRGRRAYACPG